MPQNLATIARRASALSAPQCVLYQNHLYRSPPLPLSTTLLSPQSHCHRKPTTCPFSTHHSVLKNSKKQFSKHGRDHISDHAPTTIAPDTDDPLDFGAFETEIQRVLADLKDELSKIKSGGRGIPEMIEALKVKLLRGESVVQLGELAQVMPRGGRTVVVVVGEKEHLKPITSALLSSPHSFSPTPSTLDPLELHIPIAVPTTQSRLQALDAVTRVLEGANFRLREARGVERKRLRGLGLAKKVGPDRLRRAEGLLEKVNEGGAGEVKKMAEAARRGVGG